MTSMMNARRPVRSISLWNLAGKGLILVVMAMLTSVAAAQYAGGSGTVAAPYLIATPEHMATLGDSPSDWNKHFKLANDIDLTGYNETNFTLIGIWVGLGHLSNRPFSGTFDGNGKTISNLAYRDNGDSYVGLFRFVEVGRITDLGLVNVTVTGSGSGVGSLVGYLKGASLHGCYATGVRVSGIQRVGGLVGKIDGGVTECSSRGYVSGVKYVGGLIGYVDEGNVIRSYSKTTVVGGETVGGLVGATGDTTAVVDSCYARGDVSGTAYVGGLVGSVISGRVYKSYSTGVVTGNQDVGGLVGSTWFQGDVIKSFWDVETSYLSTSDGGTGKTTAEMQAFNTFFAPEIGWDTTFWGICDGQNCPVFWWQIPVGDLACPDGVEMIDFALFALEWRRRNCNQIDFCEGADLDESGAVGYPDLAILAENWLAGVD